MEEKRAKYIIEMLFEGGTAKQQLKTLEQDLLNLNKTERAELKKAVKEKMEAIQSIAKAAKDNSGNDVLTAGLKKEVEALKGAFETLRKVFPYEEFAKGNIKLTDSFNKMDQSVTKLTKDIPELKRDIAKLREDFSGLGFKGVISEAQEMYDIIEKMSHVSIIPALDKKSVSEIKRFKETLQNSLTSISVDIEVDYEGLNKTDLTKKLRDKLKMGDNAKIDDLIVEELTVQFDALPALEEKVRGATKGTEAWIAANIELAKTLKNINALEKASVEYAGGSYFADLEHGASDAEGKIKKIFGTMEKEAKEQTRELKREIKSIIDGISNVNVKLELTQEDKEKFRNKINKFVGDVSTEIEPLNIALDIKDKGLKKEEVQERIQQAKEWRQEVAAALNKDKEKVSVYFGVQAVTDSLHDQLQKYFEDNEIDLHINKEALAKEIQAAVASGGIAGGSVNLAGGTVDINPETLAKAVAAGMQAFFTGDFTSLSTGKPKSEETPAKKPEKKFYLDPNNDYNKEVAAMFKEVIKYAQGTNKPNKQTRTFLEGKLVGTQYWDDDKKEVNFDALENADPTDLIDTLSHIVEKHGVTLVDQFGELAKSAKSQLIKNFRGELLELIGTHNFKQTTVDESIKDQKRQEMWESYSQKSRFTSGLGSLMGVAGSDVDNLKLPDVADIDKLIEYVKDNTFTQEDVDEIERKYQEQKHALEQANKNFNQRELNDISEDVKQKQYQVNAANARKDAEQAKLLQAELDALKTQENKLKEAQKAQQNASNDFEKVNRERRRIVGSFNKYNGALSQLETFKEALEEVTDESDSAQKEKFLNKVSKFADGVRGVYRETIAELEKYEWGIEVKGFKDIFKVDKPGRVGKLDNAIQGDKTRIVKPHLYKAPESLKGYVEDQPDRTDVLRQEVVVKKFRTHEMIDKELGEAEVLLQEAKNNKDEAKILQQQSRIATLKAEKDTLPTTSKRWEEENGAKKDITRQEQAAQKQANEYAKVRAEHEKKYTALMQKQNTLEEDIASREKQISETEQYIKENSGDARKLAGARKRLENREKAFQAAEEKYNQLEQSRIEAIREYQDAKRNLEDVEKGNYKQIDYLDNQIAQLEKQQRNPLQQRPELAGEIEVRSDGTRRLNSGIYQKEYNNTSYYLEQAQQRARIAKANYAPLEEKERQLLEEQKNAQKKGDHYTAYKIEEELEEKRKKIAEYKEEERQALQEAEKYQASINEILRKRNGQSKKDKADFTKDAKEYIKQQLADKKARRAQLGADPRTEARARADRAERNAQITTTQTSLAKTELDKAQKELEQVQQDELVQKSKEIEEHKNHVRIMKETNERQRKEIEEIEKQRQEGREIRKSNPLETEEKLKKAKSDIESLSKEVLELQQKVQQSRAEAEQIDKFVQDTIEDENYKKPTYDIDYNEADKAVVDKHGAYIARSVYLRGIADGTLNKDNLAPEDLTESMSQMVQSILNSREVVDALSNDFGLDKLGSEEEIRSEIQRRLEEASNGKIKLSPIIADYYARIISDGSVAAAQWLESTKTNANANIEQQKSLLQAASVDDDTSADMLDAQMKEANEHLKTTYQTRVSEWFEAIRSKLKIVGTGKGKNATAEAKQAGALAAKEIEDILKLIDNALRGYSKFKSKEYYEQLNKLDRQLKVDLSETEKSDLSEVKKKDKKEELQKQYKDAIRALNEKENNRLREELFGDNAKISRQRNKFAYKTYRDRDVNANTTALSHTQEQIKNSERYNLLLARQAELLREISDAHGDEKKTAAFETELNNINSELTQYQMASVNVSEYLKLKQREADILGQIRKAYSENKKESEIKPMEDNLENINKELDKYKAFEAQIKHSQTLSLFEDDVEFSDKYRASVAEIIKLEQEAMLARAKGETGAQIDGRYAQINTKRQELEVSVYDALQKKQESLLNSIKSNTEEAKQVAVTIDALKKNNADSDTIKKHKRHQDELERSAEMSAEQLELVNIELTELEINKRRVAELGMGKMLYKADEGTVKEYINLIRTLIALEQELALTTAQGGDTSDVDKRLKKHKTKITKEIDRMTEARHKRDASLSPNAWALQHLKETQEDYDLALQQRYAVKGRKKRVENKIADVVDDDKYSTSGQYIRHQEAVKDMLTNEYVYSDKYKADKKAGKDQALQETLEEVAKIIRTRIENAYKESGKNLDDAQIQEEINKTVENQVKAVKFRLEQSLGKKGMTIDPKKMDEAYQLFSQGGWEGVRDTFEDEFETSAEYKSLVEEREKARAEALKKEIERIEEEGNNVIQMVQSAKPEEYEPLRREMGKYLTGADVTSIEKEFKRVLGGTGKKTDINKVKSKLLDIARQFGASKTEIDDLYGAITENVSNIRHGKQSDALASILKVFQTDEGFALDKARSSLVDKQQQSMMRRTTALSGKHAEGKFYADAETEKQFRERINEAMASYVNDSLDSDKLAELFKDTDLGDSEITKGILELFKQKMVDYVYDLGKHYAENLEVKNGTIENEFAREGEEKIINIRQQVIDRLNGELAQLEKDGVLAEQNIAAIEAERKAAMEYGGVKYSDVIDAEVLRELSMLKSRLELEKEYQAELSATIDKLRAEGASSEELGVFGEELDKTTEKVNRLQNLINNDDILLELMHEERTNEDALKKRTPEELKMLYEGKKAAAEGQLESDNERVRKSAEERIARYDAILADLDKKIEANAAKEREKNDPMNIIANKFADAIKKSLGGNGGLNVDATGLATEATLMQIYEILVGIVQAMGGKVIRDPEKDAMLAELRALKAKKATAVASENKGGNKATATTSTTSTNKANKPKYNPEDEPVYIQNARKYGEGLKDKSSDELATIINNLITTIKDESKTDEEKFKAQLELQKAINSFGNKNKNNDAVPFSVYKTGDKKGQQYHSNDDYLKYLTSQYGISKEDLGLKLSEKKAKEIASKNGLFATVEPEIAPSAVAEEVKENTEQAPPVAEVKPEVAKEDANAYVAKLQEILGGVTKDTKGKENSLKAVYDKLNTPANQKGVKPFEELRAELLKLQSGNGSIEEATKKAQEFVNVFANFSRNRFADLSKWFGKDVQADATTLLGIVKQIFELTSNEQKLRKATKKAEEVKPAQQIAEAAQAEAAATAQVTEEKAEQKAIESSYTTEDARRERELEQKLGGYTGPQVDFSDADIGLAQEETLKAILNLITKIQTDGIKKSGSGAKNKKATKVDEAELIKRRALLNHEAILGLGVSDSSTMETYNALVAQLEAKVKEVQDNAKAKKSTAEPLKEVKVLAQKISAMGFNIMKEASAWDYTVKEADKVGTIDTSSTKSVREQMEELAQTDLNGKQYKFLNFDGKNLSYQLTDINGNVEKVTMSWSELNNQVAITSDKSVAKLDTLANKVQTFEDKFKNASQMGYLAEDDETYKKFLDKVADIDTQSTFEDVERVRNEALQAADEVTKKIAQNKKLYTGTTEMNSAKRQYGKLESSGILDQTGSKLVAEYKTAYEKINKVHNEWQAKNGGKGLLTDEAQKQLRSASLEANKFGKELEKAATNSQRLERLKEDSGTYHGQDIGGAFELEDNVNMYDAMVVKLKELGAEHIKVDRVRQTATGTIRHNSKTVSDLTVEYDKLNNSLVRYQKQERESLTGLPAFLSGFQKKFNSIMQYLTMTMSIHQVMAQLRRGVQYIKEIDLALTELRKVTDETEATYDKFLQTAAKTGERLGSTISAVTEATATFAKLGYTMNQATEMAEAAIVYKNVGDNIASTEDAADSIISTMKGFGLEATESMAIVDKFNEVGNRFAITSQGIGEALRLSASALNEGKNSLDESIALITAANEVVNDPSSVGTALKTLTLRLRGSKTELEEMGEDVIDMATTTSQLQAKLLALTGGKVDIMLDANTFKNTTQILREMAGAWEGMNDIQRASALELMGGRLLPLCIEICA